LQLGRTLQSSTAITYVSVSPIKPPARPGLPYLPPPIMRTLRLYAISILLTIAVIVVLFTTRGPPSLEFIAGRRLWKPVTKHVDNGPPLSTQSGWTFDYKRDARNFGLDEEQCQIAFPDLYKEIDRAVAHRKEIGKKITLGDMDVEWRSDGMVRAMIHDNQLYIIDAHGVQTPNHRPRTIATLNAIQRALTAYQGTLPNIEFTFSVHDWALVDDAENRTLWAYTRKAHHTSLWLMPDFGFWGWPDVNIRSFSEVHNILANSESPFSQKIPKIVWRGSLAVGSHDVRAGLVEHAAGQPWSDVLEIDWSNATNIHQRLLSMSDHCKYMFVAQTEGNTYSGRLKFLLSCHSILFSHQLDWIENYHHLLQAAGDDQNYVQVQRDYSDLQEKITPLLDRHNLRRTQLIADNARRIFRERYLTPAAEACYWRALIRGWAEVQGFEPQFWEEEINGDDVSRGSESPTREDGKKKKRPRGAPFEAYAIMEEVEWAMPARGRKICID